MDTEKNREKNRQHYEKPQLLALSLEAEEVLAVGCKAPGQSGPLQSGCQSPSPCNEFGS